MASINEMAASLPSVTLMHIEALKLLQGID
jgi:hypothetical protein